MTVTSEPEYVIVNGARIERSYLEENLAEARPLEWTHRALSSDEHVHCIVCNIALGEDSTDTLNADSRWLCGFCHEEFINPAREPEAA